MEYIARFPNEIISLFLLIASLIVINIFLSKQKARVDFYRPEFRFLARSDEVHENYNVIWYIFMKNLLLILAFRSRRSIKKSYRPM